MRIALRAGTGYLTAENGGNAKGLMTANRPEIGSWEIFTVEFLQDNRIALKSINGLYVCAELAGGKEVHCNRSSVGPWEAWLPSGPLQDGASLSFIAWDGSHCLSVDPHGTVHPINAYWGQPQPLRVEIVEADSQPQPGPTPPGDPLAPLHTDGWDITIEGGARYIHNQATNYLLFQRFLEGHDLDRLWYEGFNGYNVTFSMSIVPGQVGLRALRPENYDRFYERASEFFDLSASKGKRIEATLLCDCRTMGVDFDWQVRHTEQMYEVLRSKPGNLCQLVNEPENGVNSVDYGRFTKPSGVFWSRGSSLAGGQCPLPAGDYSTQHLGRSGGGAYLDAQPYYMVQGYGDPNKHDNANYVGTKGPVITNETRGASNTENSDRRTTDPAYFRRIAAAMRGWSGGTFHCDQGIHSESLEPGTPQDECRKAFLEGMGA